MILTSDDKSHFLDILSFFLTADRGMSGTPTISFLFIFILNEIRSTMMILINYYKVNKQCAVHATALTPDNSHPN